MSSTLDGRVAVVIGASSHVGERVAHTLADAGATVALVARRAERLDQIAFDIERAGGRALVYPADVTDPDAMQRVADRIEQDMGPTGVVVVNARVRSATPTDRLPEHEWARQVEVNVTATTLTIGRFLKQLVVSAKQCAVADLVTVVIHSRDAAAVYDATASYILSLSDSLRRELGLQDVRVTTVVSEEVEREGADLGTGDRLTGDDVAEAIAFAVSLPPRVTVGQVTLLHTHPRQPAPVNVSQPD